MISFQTRQFCFSIFSSHNILKSHPFFPWLKSASPPRLPGKIQFTLHISVQTIRPVRHYFPDNCQSPPHWEACPTCLFVIICLSSHPFICEQLEAKEDISLSSVSLLLAMVRGQSWCQISVFFEWTNECKITHRHICHMFLVISETLIQQNTQRIK